MYVMGMLKEGKVWVKSMLNMLLKVMLNLGYIREVRLGENGALRRFNTDLTQASWKLVAGYDIMKLEAEI